MVTRKDIAEKAGVSVSVVSRALNNSGYVDAGKKERILKIATELNYQPNPIAMSLQSRRTRQLVFFSKDLNNLFNVELYLGMLEEAKKHDYMVMLQGQLDFDKIRSLMVDGLILNNESVTERYLTEVGKSYFLPAVAPVYGSPTAFERSVPEIECNMYEGAKKAWDYLARRGHRKIAFVTPYPYDNYEARKTAWAEFARRQMGRDFRKYFFGINHVDLKNDERVMRFPEEQDIKGYDKEWESYFKKGQLAAHVFLENQCDATAVMVFNDEMALGFCKEIRKLDINIPDDLSVIGFDGIDNRKYTDYTLTTVSMSVRQMGAKCVEVLLDVINGKKVKQLTNIPYKILEGDTVKDISGKDRYNCT